jgi:hypothetical protein
MRARLVMIRRCGVSPAPARAASASASISLPTGCDLLRLARGRPPAARARRRHDGHREAGLGLAQASA